MKVKRFILGADHAGLEVKDYVRKLLEEKGLQFQDVGTYDRKRVDYPDYAEKVAEEVLCGRNRRGIFACGTGIGASIAANKIPGIRAALACTPDDARLSREHNNANFLVLHGWGFNETMISKILDAWLNSEFQRGRHLRRVRKIEKIEMKYGNNANTGAFLADRESDAIAPGPREKQ